MFVFILKLGVRDYPLTVIDDKMLLGLPFLWESAQLGILLNTGFYRSEREDFIVENKVRHNSPFTFDPNICVYTDELRVPTNQIFIINSVLSN